MSESWPDHELDEMFKRMARGESPSADPHLNLLAQKAVDFMEEQERLESLMTTEELKAKREKEIKAWAEWSCPFND